MNTLCKLYDTGFLHEIRYVEKLASAVQSMTTSVVSYSCVSFEGCGIQYQWLGATQDKQAGGYYGSLLAPPRLPTSPEGGFNILPRDTKQAEKMECS